MKKLYYFLIIALVAGLVSACSLEAPASGHLVVTVPYSFSASATKGLSTRDITFLSGTNPYIRIYVLLNGTFVNSTSSADYVEQSLATGSNLNSTSYSVDLPASTGYKVYAVLGTKDSSGWTPKYYGGSDTFTVSAGVYTNKSISVSALTFASFTPSSSATFAAVVGGTLWKIVGGSLTNGTQTISLSTYGTINSLTAGQWFRGSTFAAEPWVNTSSGIWAYNGGSTLVQRSSVAATYSGALVANIDSSTTSSFVLYYYGSDVGFAYSSDSTLSTADSFTKSGSLSSFLKSDSGSSFADLIKDPSTFLTAAAIADNGTSYYGFVATAVGSYIYNSNVQTDINSSDVAAWFKSQISSSKYAFGAYDSNGKSVSINSLALDLAPSTSVLAPHNLYAGTDSGLYYEDASNAANQTTASKLTSLVSGVKIKKLAAAYFGSTSYAAYVDGDGTLTIKGSSLPSYPFYAFTSGRDTVQSLAFYVDSGALKLAVASSDGLAILTVN
jgi:uncharacterized membrane protein